MIVAAGTAPAGSGHGDPAAAIVLALALILLAAKLGGELASRLGQPAVLGELVAGIIVGNISLLGFGQLEYLKNEPVIDMFARIGVILLLFEVGLESTIGQMMKVGASALLVAVLGVVTPFALGLVIGRILLPDQSIYAHIFLGATLTATSVGITARVLKDLDRQNTQEARIILGAAVVDDVLGLVILSAVTGIIISAAAGTGISYISIGISGFKAFAFLAIGLLAGAYLSPKALHFASKLKTPGVLLAWGLSFCFLLSWLADAIGLAPIVGAFAAGLVLEDAHYRDFKDRGEHGLEELVAPITAFLAPVFFVQMGMKTDLRVFADSGVLLLAGAITVAAVLGKQVCAFGAIGKGIDRLTIGLGMIPRGEVGLIFANIGLGLTVGNERVVDQSLFSAIVVMVVLTTLLTPPALKWSIFRKRGGAGSMPACGT